MSTLTNGFIETLLFSSDCSICAFTQIKKDCDGVVVIITDDLGKSHAEMQQNPAIIKLSDHFSTIFFDNRSTGESKYPLLGKITADTLCSDIKCVVNYAKQTFKDQPVYLFTSSYGAIATLLFLSKYPNDVDKVIFDSPMIFPGNPTTQVHLMDYWKRSSKKYLSVELADIIHNYPSTTIGLEQLLATQELSNFVASNTPLKHKTEMISHFFTMNDFITICDLRPIIENLKTQTLFLQGVLDKIAPYKILQQAVCNNPNLCLSLFKNLGHKIYEQSSDEFARICTEFYFG